MFISPQDLYSLKEDPEEYYAEVKHKRPQEFDLRVFICDCFS